MAYVYQADVWCDKCGEKIRAELTAEGKAPEDPDNETSYDSGEFPKYFDAEWDSANSPQNCASGDCGGKYWSEPVKDFVTYGTFLENPLTAEGYRYLKSMLDESGETLTEPAAEWAKFYDFTYHKNEYESAHDWLQKTVQHHASMIGECTHSAALLGIINDIIPELDGDTIQDLFQSDMDADGFFRETGWNSSEMESD